MNEKQKAQIVSAVENMDATLQSIEATYSAKMARFVQAGFNMMQFTTLVGLLQNQLEEEHPLREVVNKAVPEFMKAIHSGIADIGGFTKQETDDAFKWSDQLYQRFNEINTMRSRS